MSPSNPIRSLQLLQKENKKFLCLNKGDAAPK